MTVTKSGKKCNSIEVESCSPTSIVWPQLLLMPCSQFRSGQMLRIDDDVMLCPSSANMLIRGPRRIPWHAVAEIRAAE